MFSVHPLMRELAEVSVKSFGAEAAFGRRPTVAVRWGPVPFVHRPAMWVVVLAPVGSPGGAGAASERQAEVAVCSRGAPSMRRPVMWMLVAVRAKSRGGVTAVLGRRVKVAAC
jgi:hypothetical protein